MPLPLTRRSALLAATVASAMGLAACGTSAATVPGTTVAPAPSGPMSTMSMPATAGAAPAAPVAPVATDHVAIQSFAFGPGTVTVRPGTTVTWTQQDEDQHTVTADDASFASSPLVTGQTYTHTFTAPGTYRYHCAIHPFMHGTVTVTDG
jgi:plastocyanin